MKRVLFKSEFKAILILFCVTMRCEVAFPSFQIFEEEKSRGWTTRVWSLGAGRRKRKKRRWGQMTGRRERLWSLRGQMTDESGDKQRKMMEGGLAFGEWCNLKATDQQQEGPADEI